MVQPDLGLANLPVLDQFQVGLLSLLWSQPHTGAVPRSISKA